MLYEPFYRKYGVRKVEHLATPRLAPMADLKLPISSMLHYIAETNTNHGMSSSDPLLAEMEKLVLVEHVDRLFSDKGTPRNTQLSAQKLSRDYHKKNRRFRPLKRIETVDKDKKSLIVVNYALLSHLYRYTSSFYASYYKWYNIQSTLWTHVDEMANISVRQQFVRCHLPDTLPSLAQLNAASSGDATKKTLSIFDDEEKLNILDIWKWLGETTEESLLSNVSVENLSKVNLLWSDHGRWFTMNLGTIYSWISGEEGGLSRDQAQRRFLRMLITLYEARTVVDTKTLRGTKSDESEDLDDPLKALEKSKVEEDVSLSDDEIEKDLEQLDKIAESQAEEASNQEIEEVKPSTVQDGVMKRVDALADAGQLSAAEYRRMAKMAEKHTTIPNPRGDGTLMDLAKITKEDVAINSYSQLPDMEGVSDKSMLQSVLLDFDNRYTQEVLPKDIANAILFMQKAGVAVTDYKVQHIEDAMNNFEVHTVKVIPPTGKASTIRFRVPVISESGTFKADGVNYSMRKQRGDLPIRKVSPSRVALTSYYSKLFVGRSEKKTNDPGTWMVNQIVGAGLDVEDDRVTDLKISDNFDHELKVPYLYSALSGKFRSFKFKNGMTFFFDYHNRIDEFKADALAKYEDERTIVCGRKGKQFILMDDTNTLYQTQDKGPHLVLGSMAELGEFELAKMPVEVAELKVFSKAIPMGLVLGYYMGLDNLIKKLGVEVRRVPAGSQLRMQDDEVAIRFNDESIIFARTDRMATMILAGFNAYKRTVKNYSVYDFNKKDVYSNVLEANGITVPYVREIDMLLELFVDHITGDILASMNEPTEFIPLLMRSCELLLTNWHPSEVDHSYQRVKGYERIAGTIYSEIAKSLRTHASRPASAKAEVTMNPEAVWQQILQDPALTLIDDANPLYNIRDKEVVTFGGTGGRSARSMVKRTRVYTENDIGVISESTVDNSAVGVVTYLTADPNFTSLRGVSRRYDAKSDGATKVMSSSALISPGADRDDPKRVLMNSYKVSLII